MLAHPWLKETDDEDDEIDEDEELTPMGNTKKDTNNNLGGFVQGGPGEENKTEVDIKAI